MSKTVLVVDDDELARKGLHDLLIEPQVDVEMAANGKEGLKLALEKHPDLIVTDVHMPEMDGLKMIDELRKNDWGKKVPVVVMTVDEETTSLNKALEAGVTVYLTKTNVDPVAIADQIRIALG